MSRWTIFPAGHSKNTIPHSVLDDKKLETVPDITNSLNNPKEGKPGTTISLEDAKKIGDEYGELMILPTLSEAQEDRIEAILVMATVHGNIDFWISRAAYHKGADIGLLSPAALHDYENQRAVLRERLDLDAPLASTVESNLLQQIRAARKKAIEKISTEAHL